MSYIGINIRKIRGVKNLNQSAFADLFNLKRASVGAYEEGRAEPKINTIIEIANYFGISMDELLTKELSVNDLYKFDIFREDLIKDSKHNLTPSLPAVGVIPIPFVSKSKKAEYLTQKDSAEFLESLENIQLPLTKGGNYCAFEIEDNAMIGDSFGIYPTDIVICEKPKKFSSKQLEANKIYLFETADDILLRTYLSQTEDSFQLSALNANHYASFLTKEEVLDVWQVNTLITHNVGKTSPIENRLQLLEAQLKALTQDRKA